ncbi:30080_t:CDS:2 [Gigaspora margarita]|uniref:30080_t:CDS:1 n=1 Tax=Gigaspora margarita TaxID=4874 RepID=A0ABM8VZ96_GIGMA|nr:30080_t:CDS:2 [Gigaspora margarita]
MQQIEKRYNELKNQLRSLQNAKNKLAKSQPYKDIRNTEYMSHYIKGWLKNFLEQGTLPRHQQRKHAKRELLLDDEDLKLVACTWLHSILTKDHFPLALKKELETNIFSKLLGIYFDGYERKDVREYYKGWAIRMINYQKKMEQYDSDEMENVIPLEQLEIWDMCHVLVTHDEAYFYTNDDNLFIWVEDKESIIKKKGQESAIMASDFLCAYHGPLHLTEADTIQLGKNMVQQLRKKTIPIFNTLRPECIGISTNHNAYALDVLVCSRMTLYPKVENKFKFKDVPNCCTRYTLTIEPDFLEQKTLIAKTVEATRHIFELYPKFHCECNFIERFWGAAKRIAHQHCGYSYAQLQLRVSEILNNIPLPIIR